jgi:hypothetical protein
MVPVASACKVCVIIDEAVTGSVPSPKGPEKRKKKLTKHAVQHIIT